MTSRYRIRPRVLISFLLLLGGCAAGTRPLTSTTHPPHANPVFVTKASLSPESFEPVADLELSKGWYGSTDNTQQALADRARELGADAVINMKSWHAPSAWSWASPYSSGQAVKLRGDPKQLLNGITGDWR